MKKRLFAIINAIGEALVYTALTAIIGLGIRLFEMIRVAATVPKDLVIGVLAFIVTTSNNAFERLASSFKERTALHKAYKNEQFVSPDNPCVLC